MFLNFSFMTVVLCVYLEFSWKTLPRLLLCLHVTSAVSLPLLLLLLLLLAIYSHFELSSLSSVTVAHWKRWIENALHLICTNKCRCLQASITDKMFFSIFYITINFIITHFLEIL